MQVFLDLDGPILCNRRKYHRIYSDLLEGEQILDEATYWELKRNWVPEGDILRRTQIPEDRIEAYQARRPEVIEPFDYLLLDRLQDRVLGVLDEWRLQHPARTTAYWGSRWGCWKWRPQR